MSEEQQFCLRWNNFQANFTSQFEALRTAEEFVDVTLACDGQRLQAHRLVLSACSPYFKELFRSNPCKHPILFLRDVEFCHLQSLVEFMYAGEVNVAQAQLSTFLQTAEALQIRGLTEAPQRHKEIQGHKRKQFSHTENYSSPEEDNVEDNDDDDDDEVLCISSPSTNSPPAKMMRNMNESYDEFNTAQSAQPRVSLKHVVQLAAQKSHLMLQNQEIEAFQEEGCETFQPKIEAPDYNSDEECKTENSGVSGSFIGLDNSLEMNNTMTAVQGGAEILPGNSSQNFMDVSQDLTQADLRKLHSLDPRPCPICFRMYSNLSNLRQHVRLIHNPQTVVCPLCNKPFKTKLYLKRHLMGFHEISNISTVKSSQPQGRQTDMSESSRSIQRLVSNTSSKEKFPNESEEHNVPFQNKTVYSNVQQSKDVPPMYISSQQYNDKDNRPLVAQSNRNYNDAQTQMCSTNTESYVPELMKLQNSSCCSNNRNDNNNIDTLNCNRVVFHDLSEKTQQDLSQYSNPAITSINKVQDENMYSNCMTNCAGAEKPHSVGSEVHVSHFLSQEPEEDNTSSANKCNEISYFTSVLEYNKNDQSCNTVHTLDQK